MHSLSIFDFRQPRGSPNLARRTFTFRLSSPELGLITPSMIEMHHTFQRLECMNVVFSKKEGRTTSTFGRETMMVMVRWFVGLFNELMCTAGIELTLHHSGQGSGKGSGKG